MPSPPRRRPVAAVVVAAVVVAVVVFAAVTGAGLVATASAAWTTADMQVVVAANSVHNAVFSAVAYGVNIGFGPVSAAVLTIVVVAGTGWATRSGRVALRLGLLIALPWASADVVKAVVRRPRPDVSLLTYVTGVEPTTFSFPSGHTAFAVALSAAIVVTLGGRARTVAVVIGVVVVATTAWSRVYLGAHYPTDVVASIVLVPTGTWAVYEITQRVPWFAAVSRRSGEQSPRQA